MGSEITTDALTPARRPRHEAIKRRDVDGGTLRSFGRSYNVTASTILKLEP